jgi:hypothetical protein
MDDVAVQSLKLVVLKLVVSPSAAKPTATQLSEEAHETADRIKADGSELTVTQVAPALCVPIIAAAELTTPTAMHVFAAGQETLDRESRFFGEGCVVQVAPLRVPTIPKPPTAVH